MCIYLYIYIYTPIVYTCIRVCICIYIYYVFICVYILALASMLSAQFWATAHLDQAQLTTPLDLEIQLIPAMKITTIAKKSAYGDMHSGVYVAGRKAYRCIWQLMAVVLMPTDTGNDRNGSCSLLYVTSHRYL